MERKFIPTFEKFFESKSDNKNLKEVEKKGEVTFYEDDKGNLYQKSKNLGELKVKNGTVKYHEVEKCGDCTIKYELNGANGFSVWKDGKNMEDNIWTLTKAKKVCDKICDKKVNEGKAKTEVDVIFRKHKKDGDIIAFFPYEIENKSKKFILSYQHDGQHSGASIEFFKYDTVKATESEYKELKKELEDFYEYKLNVITNIDYKKMNNLFEQNDNSYNENMTATKLKATGKKVKPIEGKEYRVIGFLSNTMAGAKFTVRKIEDGKCYFKGYKKGGDLDKLSFYEVEEKSVNESRIYTETAILSDGNEITITIDQNANYVILDSDDLNGNSKKKYSHWDNFQEDVIESYILYIENALMAGEVELVGENIYEMHQSWKEIKDKYGYDVEDREKKYRVKILPIEKKDLVSGLPSFSKTGSIEGMRQKYYGKNALLVKCGNYIYNVSANPEIYFNEAK